MARSNGYSFGLCLSHDVDRIYKTYQYPYRTLKNRDVSELTGAFNFRNPYWQFEKIIDIESELDVRSSFNVIDEIPLSERPVSDWFTKSGWMLHAGMYDVTDEKIAATMSFLSNNGWEISLQGSYTSSENPRRFEYEKDRIESAAGATVIGNRQHHWRLSRPDTWEHLQRAGIKYDTSLGSSTEMEFQHGHSLIRPFDDEFVVFPWSLMDGSVMESGDDIAEIRSNLRSLLETAREERTVLVADWHQRVFHDDDFPNWSAMYRELITEALEMGAWVGPPGEFYRAIPQPDGTIEEALENLGDS